MVNSGSLGDGFHTLTERVYFEHTDFSGVVYHTRYLDFLEHGRSDYVRMLGVHHKQMNAAEFGEPLVFAVHRMEIEFKAAARIDDVLTIETQRGQLQGLRLTFNQTIRRDAQVLLEAVVTVILMNPQGKPRRYPGELLLRLGVS